MEKRRSVLLIISATVMIVSVIMMGCIEKGELIGSHLLAEGETVNLTDDGYFLEIEEIDYCIGWTWSISIEIYKDGQFIDREILYTGDSFKIEGTDLKIKLERLEKISHQSFAEIEIRKV